MGRRSLGLALTSLALVVPASAHAAPKAQEADPYKVLVVTSTSDALATAGVNAITQAVGADGVVTAPPPADGRRAVHARGPGRLSHGRVPEHGHGEPAQRCAARELRGVLQEGRRLRRHRLRRRDRLELDVPDEPPRHPLGGPGRRRRPARSRSSTASTTRPRTCRSTGIAPRIGTTSRPTSAARRTCSRPWSRTRSASSRPATCSTASPAARWAPITRSPSARTTRAAAPSTPASAPSAAAFNASLQTHLKGAIAWAAGQSNAATSDCGATVTKNYQQTKISAPPNLNEPIGFDQLPDGRIIQTSRRGDVRLHDPAKGTTTVLADFGAASVPQTHARLHQLRGRHLRPGGRQQLRHQQVGLPLLLAADRHRRQAVGRLDRHADHAEHGGAELGGEHDGVGPVRRLLPALALQVRRGRRRRAAWT